MKVGLVHGRFQPFHNGHKFLIDKMLEECELAVVLISIGTEDERNLYSLQTREEMIRSIYPDKKRLLIGANLDLPEPHAIDAPWDILFSSCVLSLTGHLPTHVYVGDDYGVLWDNVRPEIRKFGRYDKISATQVRKLILEGKLSVVKQIVPEGVFKIVDSR